MTGATNAQLLERDAELHQLGAALQRAKAGAGQIALIEGPAGAGKSALMAAAIAAADDGRTRILRAGGSEFERDFAFGAVRQLFEPLLTGASEEERDHLLAGTAAPAEWVVQATGDPDTTRTRAEAGLAVLHAVYWLAANASARGPLLLAVDDLHWVDEPSLRALSYLARRVSDLPIAVVTTMRPSEPGASAPLLDELRALPDAVRIVPPSLSQAAVAAIVRAQFRRADAGLCEAFFEASAGNPLYLRELLLSTVAEGLKDTSTAAHAVEETSIPALAERLLRRIDRVSPDARELATAIALLGDGASLSLASALAGLQEGPAAQIARRLTEIEVLASDDPVAFAHPVLRRSVYERLSSTQRQTRHARAAALLAENGAAVDAIATHMSALAPAGSDAVAATLLDAAHQAASRAAPDSAIALLRRALAEDASEPGQDVLLYELGKAEMAVRDPSAVAHLQEALELTHHSELRAWVAVSLVELLAAAGQWEACVGVITRAREGAEGQNSEMLAEMESVRALVMAYDPRLVEGFDRERDQFAELSMGEGWAAHALASVLASAAGMRSEPHRVVMPMVERALAGGRLLRERGGGAWAAAQVLWALVFIEEYDRGLEASDLVLAEGRRTGSLLGQITGVGYRGMIFTKTGDLRAAEAELSSVLDLVVESGMYLWLASAAHAFGDAIVERPQLAHVVDQLEAMDLEPVFLATSAGSMVLELRGRLALAEGNTARARQALEACAATNMALGMGPTYSSWRSALALSLPEEEKERADALVAEELSLARASGFARPQGVALRTAGLLAGGERGLELLRESAATLDGSSGRLEHARSLVELGAALRRRQQRAEAREHLSAGMQLADHCGADRLVARADEELHRLGDRPRRVARTGTAALTASELRVARLAAAGRSNTEIAQELYVSTKTIESHLSNAYGKLGFSGRGARGQLAGALSSAPPL